MKHSVEKITGDAPARQELAGFLANFEDENRGEAFWHKRLAFWWDENPFSSRDLLKGWVLRCDGEIVGFLGLIPFEYVHGEKIYRAFAATTWRVEKEHRNASLPMFMKWHTLGREFILLDTTANEEVAKILDRFQYRAMKTVRNYFFPLRAANGLKGMILRGVGLLNRFSLPQRPLKIVTLADPFKVEQSHAGNFWLRKKISREYLKWLCASPHSPKEFIGSVNEAGVLASYIIVQPDKYGAQDVLSVVDYFTTRCDDAELFALLWHVGSRSPRTQPFKGEFSFLMLNVLGMENFLDMKRLGIFYRKNQARHYYSLPKALDGIAKHCVMAEGDFGC